MGVKPGYTASAGVFRSVAGGHAGKRSGSCHRTGQWNRFRTPRSKPWTKGSRNVWTDSIQAGNLYINRGTTGAMVLRQPFGGMKKSVLAQASKWGALITSPSSCILKKMGRPLSTRFKMNMPVRLAQEWMRKIRGEYKPIREDVIQTIRAVKSYLYHYEQEFSRQKDYFHLRGQDNLHRYLPLGTIAIRLHAEDRLFDVLARLAATRIAGNVPLVSIPTKLNNDATTFLNTMEGRQIVGKAIVRRQSDEELIASLAIVQGVRYAAPDRVPEAVLAAAATKGFYIARAPVLMEGRIEMLHYCQNQSICDTYHRYGNLGDRSVL